MENVDFAHLRLTNAAPTSHDKKLIHGVMDGIDSEVYKVNKAISLLEIELKKLKATHAGHMQRRSDYAGLVSPLRSMPLEILGEIFLYASAESLPVRLFVSHVCQLWRNAALATSELWSTIDGRFPQDEQRFQEYTQACVQRARSRPLILTYSPLRPLGYSAITVLLQTTETCRWKIFSWDTLEFTFFESILNQLSSTSHDTLESLSLHGYRDNDAPTSTPIPLYLISSFSRLCSLSFTLSEEMMPTIRASWVKLTRLFLSSSTANVNTTFEILRQCSNLEECTISSLAFHRPWGNSPSRTHPIHLAKLRKLHLFNNEDLFTALTGVLVTPVLEELVLHYSEESRSESITRREVYQYVLANAQTLRRLWLFGISHTEISKVIIHLVLLEELTLVLIDDRDTWRVNWSNVISALDPHFENDEDQAQIPLPHLRALNIFSMLDTDIRGAFLDVIQSRWWPDSDVRMAMSLVRLEHASLHDFGTYNVISDSDIEKLRKEGLDVNVLSTSEQRDLLWQYRPRFTDFTQMG